MFAELTRFWEDRKAGRDPDAKAKFENAVATARQFGVPYLSADEIVQKGVEEVVSRFKMLLAPKLLDDEKIVSAVLGGVKPVAGGIMLSDMIDEVAKINATDQKEMSPHQQKKWPDIREDQIKNFIEVIGGDKRVSEVSRDDAKTFRLYLQNRVLDDEITTSTANSYLFRLTGMFSVIDQYHQLDLQPIFQKLAFKKEECEQREAFSLDHIQNCILAEGMFDDLNAEARGVIYLMAETGLRLSEASVEFAELRAQSLQEYADAEVRCARCRAQWSGRTQKLLDEIAPYHWPPLLMSADEANAGMNKPG